MFIEDYEIFLQPWLFTGSRSFEKFAKRWDCWHLGDGINGTSTHEFGATLPFFMLEYICYLWYNRERFAKIPLKSWGWFTFYLPGGHQKIINFTPQCLASNFGHTHINLTVDVYRFFWLKKNDTYLPFCFLNVYFWPWIFKPPWLPCPAKWKWRL